NWCFVTPWRLRAGRRAPTCISARRAALATTSGRDVAVTLGIAEATFGIGWSDVRHRRGDVGIAGVTFGIAGVTFGIAEVTFGIGWGDVRHRRSDVRRPSAAQPYRAGRTR